jgi:ribosomal protein S18 acetylase RimI-like enzyme
MTNTTQDEVLESMVQYTSVWKVLVAELPGADLEDKPGLSISWADSPFPFWNAVFLTESFVNAAQLKNRLREAAVYARQKRQAGLIYVCEEYLTSSAKAALPSALGEAKLELSLPVHGMAGNILPLTARSHPTLQMRRVTDEAQLMVYADINCEGYGLLPDWGRIGLRGTRLWTERAYSYLGYEGDHPVCAASAIAHDGNLYLALVATRPHAQRKGYGEAVVRHALQSAHDCTGLTRTVLHASDAGRPVYRRVGYHKTASILAYKLSE